MAQVKHILRRLSQYEAVFTRPPFTRLVSSASLSFGSAISLRARKRSILLPPRLEAWGASASEDLVCGDTPHPVLRATRPAQPRCAGGGRRKHCAAATFAITATSDLPDGRRLRIPVQPSREKYFTSVFQKSVALLPHPASMKRGVTRESSRNVGRDAVDATVSCAHEIAGRRES
jgi:hypothetical protein